MIQREGHCPKCGGANLEYGTVEFYDDQCYFPRECEDCKANGKERYSLEFTGHEVYNEEAKEYVDVE